MCPLVRREIEIRVGAIAVEKLAVVANGFSGPERLPQIRAYLGAFGGERRHYLFRLFLGWPGLTCSGFFLLFRYDRKSISRRRPLADLHEPPTLHKAFQPTLEGSLRDILQSLSNFTTPCAVCTLPHEVHDRCQIFCYVVHAAICHYPPPSNCAIAGIAPIKAWNRATCKGSAPYSRESRHNCDAIWAYMARSSRAPNHRCLSAASSYRKGFSESRWRAPPQCVTSCAQRHQGSKKPTYGRSQ